MKSSSMPWGSSGGAAEAASPTTTVAAAALVPYSLTSSFVAWMTWER